MEQGTKQKNMSFSPRKLVIWEFVFTFSRERETEVCMYAREIETGIQFDGAITFAKGAIVPQQPVNPSKCNREMPRGM